MLNMIIPHEKLACYVDGKLVRDWHVSVESGGPIICSYANDEGRHKAEVEMEHGGSIALRLRTVKVLHRPS